MLNRLLYIMLALAATAAHAGNDVFAASGPGNLTCGAYLAADEHERNVYGWWLSGFITGANSAKGRKTALAADAKAGQAWVDEYCRAHALDLFVMAAVKLDEELDRRARIR
jgi:hypothetical protein